MFFIQAPTDQLPKRRRHRRSSWRLALAVLAVLASMIGALVSGPAAHALGRTTPDSTAGDTTESITTSPTARSATPESADAPSGARAQINPMMPIDDDPPNPPDPEDPPPPPEPEPEPAPTPPPPRCDDPAGFARPTGDVAPGYIYTPTTFTGPQAGPQEDDTFAADAPGHTVHVGELRTRVVNGQEEMLVCAHVGTNTPEDFLTAFPKPAPNPYAATISPRVVLIDALGHETIHEFGEPGTDSTISHYRGSTDFHDGYAQMWVPFNEGLKEPGFIVRVEIRGTSALVGGRAIVMGADEVYVHLGPAPYSRGVRVPEAFGLNIDDSAIGERPEDQGPDDLSALLAPEVENAIKAKVASFAPFDIQTPTTWHANPFLFYTMVSGTVQTLGMDIDQFKLDVENFNATEGRGTVHMEANVYPRGPVHPHTAGGLTVTDDSWCQVNASVRVVVDAAFVVNLADNNTRPEVHFGFIEAHASLQSVDAQGELTIDHLFTVSCDRIDGDVPAGMVDLGETAMNALGGTDVFDKAVTKALAPGDLANGPLSSTKVNLPNGLGFQLLSPRYVPTAAPGHIGGDVAVDQSGARIAAGVLVYDKGGHRFPYSATPSSSTSSLVNATGLAGGRADLGLVINGATVNQLFRALTAGEVRPDSSGAGTVEVGVLDQEPTVLGVKLRISPAVPPMYLPTPPAGWPAPVAGPLNIMVPSLRVRVPGVASVAVDLRAGASASIDDNNHVVPEIRASKVEVAARFLRLEVANFVIDPVLDPQDQPSAAVAAARAAVEASVPDAVGAMLRPIGLPDLSVGDGPQVHLDHLSIETVGGHLGVFADVEPGPGPHPELLRGTWTSGADGAPTQLTATVLPPLVPLPGDPKPTTVAWTITDSNGTEVYKSPAAGDTDFTKTIPATGLPFTTTDPCTGARRVRVTIAAVVTKDGVRKDASINSVLTWEGPRPEPLPPECEPSPPPDPEPTDPPIPPICRTKPWLCEP